MMLLPKVAGDVMFAHCAVGTTSQPKATSLGEADITCPHGQTSFGEPALSQVAVRTAFILKYFAQSFTLPRILIISEMEICRILFLVCKIQRFNHDRVHVEALPSVGHFEPYTL
jgi:hypothetical protein